MEGAGCAGGWAESVGAGVPSAPGAAVPHAEATRATTATTICIRNVTLRSLYRQVRGDSVVRPWSPRMSAAEGRRRLVPGRTHRPDTGRKDTTMLTNIAGRIDGFTGAVHLPGDDGYELGRQSLNPAVDARPVMVAEAARPEDVRAAVLAARAGGLPLAVQATGHGTHVPGDGGILLRTGALDRVEIDPVRQVARVGPGTRWGRVLREAARYGLAPLSGSSPDVGVTG